MIRETLKSRLEQAGVSYDPRLGVKVNDHLQTTNARIYAAGDICMKWKFTHAADAAARIVIQNALFLGRKKLGEARERGVALDSFIKRMSEVDRAIADGETEGFVKVHARKGSAQLLGATIVARHAGEMIGEIALAMTGKLGLGTIANAIHPYPTQAEAIRKTAEQWNRTRLTPSVQRLLNTWLSWRR